MTTKLSMDELRRLPLEECQKAIKEASVRLAKLRIHVALQREKDTAKLRRERRQLARFKTALRERE